MRTTISLEDPLGRAARERAAAEGLSLSAYIARLLRGALTRQEEPEEPPPFTLVTVGGGGPLPGIDLDRSTQLLVDADEERFGRV